MKLITDLHENIFAYSYPEIRDKFIAVFLSQCGNLQFDDIKRRIESSNTFNKLIIRSKVNRSYVTEESIIGALLTIPHFMFKNGYIQYLAGLLALERWNREANRFTKVQSEDDLKHVTIEMFLYIDRTKGFRI